MVKYDQHHLKVSGDFIPSCVFLSDGTPAVWPEHVDLCISADLELDPSFWEIDAGCDDSSVLIEYVQMDDKGA